MGRTREQAHPALCWAIRAMKSPQGAGEGTQVGGREAQGGWRSRKARRRVAGAESHTPLQGRQVEAGGQRGAWEGAGLEHRRPDPTEELGVLSVMMGNHRKEVCTP